MPIVEAVREHQCPQDKRELFPAKWRLLTWNGKEWHLKPPEKEEVKDFGVSYHLPVFPGWEHLVPFYFCPFCGEELKTWESERRKESEAKGEMR